MAILLVTLPLPSIEMVMPLSLSVCVLCYLKEKRIDFLQNYFPPPHLPGAHFIGATSFVVFSS